MQLEENRQLSQQEIFTTRMFQALSRQYNNRHELQGQPLDRIIAHPAIEAIAHYIVARAETERENIDRVHYPLFNHIETALRHDWMTRQEHRAAGISPERTKNFLKGTAELFISSEVVGELEKMLEKVGVKIPHLFESKIGQMAEGEAINLFLHRFRTHIADAVVEADTVYNPVALREDIETLAERIYR